MDSTPTPTRPPVVWPEGRKFAFTVLDDTDGQTVDNTKAVYDLLYDLGFRTTKTVWPLGGNGAPHCGGLTRGFNACRSARAARRPGHAGPGPGDLQAGRHQRGFQTHDGGRGRARWEPGRGS